MNITEHEMRGLLSGKCLPGDMRVNEELPAYLVRKFAELNEKMNFKENLTEQVVSLQRQCDALAVECAALKQVFATKEFSTEVTDAFSDTAVLRIDGDEYHSFQWVDNDSAVIRAVLEAMRPETPTTDAYLNSVRAEGVEIFADWLKDQAITFDAHGRHGWANKNRVSADAAKRMAAQLRAGEPS